MSETRLDSNELVVGTTYTDHIGDMRTMPDNSSLLAGHNIFSDQASQVRQLAQAICRRLEAHQPTYLLGLNIGHNSGLALVELSEKGINLLANVEEERFSGVKHAAGYPELSVKEMVECLGEHQISHNNIVAICYGWESVAEEQYGLWMNLKRRKLIDNPRFAYMSSAAAPDLQTLKPAQQTRKNLYSHSTGLIDVVERLRLELSLDANLICVQQPHHESHAYFAYAASPFSNSQNPTLISCIDGAGDQVSASIYVAENNQISPFCQIPREHSLGVFYMLCSCFLGGWQPLSSEGRYMGASAWGNLDRLTNPYYKGLRQYFVFETNGRFSLNNVMSEENYAGLQNVIGDFLSIDELWNPDAVLDVDRVEHARITTERVDKAAAVQLVFEDVLFHIIGHAVNRTGIDQLVLCGGTALNCVANMRLLEHFDKGYYSRYFQRETQLNLWVPPIPSDQGVVPGAAYRFAMNLGVNPGAPLQTPFLCGRAATQEEIVRAIDGKADMRSAQLGNIECATDLIEVAELMAALVANSAVVGIFQGSAETGPRALGHRSILSNPCDPQTLAVLNERVKKRERVRPLAPMVTAAAAEELYELLPGASAGDFDAYNYMVLTAKAREEAKAKIPAVIHHDGTSRIQIVRQSNNPLIHAYLLALEKLLGVAVSVNTSLNVGSPIVQTPDQALEIFNRASGLDAIFLVSRERSVFVVWSEANSQTHPSRLPEVLRLYLAGKNGACLAELRAELGVVAQGRNSVAGIPEPLPFTARQNRFDRATLLKTHRVISANAGPRLIWLPAPVGDASEMLPVSRGAGGCGSAELISIHAGSALDSLNTISELADSIAEEIAVQKVPHDLRLIVRSPMLPLAPAVRHILVEKGYKVCIFVVTVPVDGDQREVAQLCQLARAMCHNYGAGFVADFDSDDNSDYLDVARWLHQSLALAGVSLSSAAITSKIQRAWQVFTKLRQLASDCEAVPPDDLIFIRLLHTPGQPGHFQQSGTNKFVLGTESEFPLQCPEIVGQLVRLIEKHGY